MAPRFNFIPPPPPFFDIMDDPLDECIVPLSIMRKFMNLKIETPMNKEIKIVPPEGYEIDKDNSTFETIRFKPVKEYPTTIYELKEVKGWAVDKCTRDLDKLKVSTQTEDCIKIWPYKKYAKAVRHLCELQHLAIIWNDGHVNLGYPIAFAVTRNAFGEIVVDKTGIEKPLLFDTELKAIRFLKQFKDRLEIAAPLL